MTALREPLVRGETMAARLGNDADGRRTTPGRAGVLLRALTLVAFAAGVWCLMGTANALAGEQPPLRQAGPGAPVRADAVLPPRFTGRGLSFRPPVELPFRWVTSGAATLPPSARRALPDLSPPGADLVSETTGALLVEARDRVDPQLFLLRSVLPGEPGALPGPGRASRGGPPRAGLVPPGAGPAPEWSIVDRCPAVRSRAAPWPDLATPPAVSVCAPAPDGPRPAHPFRLDASARHPGTPVANPDGGTRGGPDQTPGLCALAHETPTPSVPPHSSWVASRIVPALCLHGSEPPVSPD
jgi:hypothetical protein